MLYLKTGFSSISIILTLALIPLSLLAQDEPILLEYQGGTRIGGVYWEGIGLRVTWKPDFFNSYIETPFDLLASDEVEFDVGHLNVEVTDSSILTKNEAQWVAPNRKASLARQISDSDRLIHAIQYRYGIADGYLDVDTHLFQSEPFPIYVYGTKGSEGAEILRFGQESYAFYEEYLVETIYAQISYSGEPEQWFNNVLQYRRDDIAEQRREMYFITAATSVGFMLAVISLWLLRHRIAAVLYWIKKFLVDTLNWLSNLLKFGKGKSPELVELELQLKSALEKGDYDEASRLAELAERVKKIGM